MSKKTSRRIVPRNPVARSPLMRRGGVHQRSRSSIRQRQRNELRRMVNERDD